MKKQLSQSILLLSMVLMLFLSSCSGYSGGDGNIHYRTGSQALEMRFLNPGHEDFFENDDLVILVEYFNRGTADITNGEFFLSGYDQSYLTFPALPYFNMEGKDEYDPTGERSQLLSIQSTKSILPSNSEEFTQTLKLTACYDYKTLATAEICVDSDPHGRRQTDKTCYMSAVSPGSQGAPIVVTRVEPFVSNNDFRLDIEFTNSGDGVVYDRTLSTEECFAALDKYSDVDKVDVTRVEFSGRQLTCQQQNPIRLINGRGKVTCECKGCISEYLDTFTTQVVMEFAYGYRNEEFKTVRLLKE